ncbi:hypothetical protein [Halorarius litoreus]|uniref:hypothetical protein n=1 Tax=Halorarius litoreus TaxID=2962676 RepID=UPI0020CBAB43|nr:hypothetical protein [Halorarius litoreus]
MTADSDATVAENEELDWGVLLERVIVAMSILLIVGTLGYVGLQAATASEGAEPTATIIAVDPTADIAGQQVTVQFDNRKATGLLSAQVGVQCGSVSRTLSFTHVPAQGHRTGTVICPAATTPEASVETWIET